MDISIQKAKEILEGAINHGVRYRTEENQDFTDDIINEVVIDNEFNVTIKMQNNIVRTDKVQKVSISEYSERIDMWFYGAEETNRFNVFNK